MVLLTQTIRPEQSLFLHKDKGEFLEVRAFAYPRVKTGFLTSRAVPLEDIAKALVETARGTPLELFATAKPKKVGGLDGFEVVLYPNATPVAISGEKHIVHFSAITSFLGPGYHAFIIAALDAVQAKLGLKWDFGGRMDDNTGYVRTRDFPSLQQSMALFFRARCGQVVEWRSRPRSAGTPEAYLGIPAGEGIEADENEVLTPFGPKSFEEVAHWSTLDGPSLARAAADFFPWSGQGFDGAFFRGFALSLMWRWLRWAKPFERGEGRVLVAVLSSLNQAMQRGVPRPVSLSVISELMALVGSDAPVFPQPNGIGYRRRSSPVTRDGWSVRVPGSLVAEVSERGTFAAGNGAFRIQMSGGTLSPGADPGARSLARGEVEKGHGFFPADDGKGFVLDAVARTPSARGPDRLCLVKIWMADEKWRNLAEAIADSVAPSKT